MLGIPLKLLPIKYGNSGLLYPKKGKLLSTDKVSNVAKYA